jgi:hypothetical protein
MALSLAVSECVLFAAQVDELLGDMTEEEDTLGASAAFNKDDDDVEISDIEIDEDELREGLQSDSYVTWLA